MIRFRRSIPSVLALAIVAVAAACTSAPPRDDEALTRIAFGSCLDQDRPQEIAAAVQAYRPDLFLFLGDNVYGDVEGDSLDNLLQAYRTQAANPGFARIVAAPRVLAVWDDHDYGVNDGGGDFALRHRTEALFLDFWDVPAQDPRRGREGVYGSFTFGPEGRRVQVILLDTRSFRSPLRPTDERDAPGKERYLPDDSPDKTLLGEAQWRWLEEVLQEPAELRLIGSSIQVAADGHGYERWGLLPAERARLYALLARAEATPTAILSGDRHFAAIYRVPLGDGRRVWEVTSSSLNRPWRKAKESGPNLEGQIYAGENFGAVEIDWQARRAVLAVHDMDGQRVREVALDLGP